MASSKVEDSFRCVKALEKKLRITLLRADLITRLLELARKEHKKLLVERRKNEKPVQLF